MTMQNRGFAPPALVDLITRIAVFAIAATMMGVGVARPIACRAATRAQWALLVGVANNVNPENKLLGPENDVPAMREMLLGRYGFASDHLRVVADAKATRAGILAGWEWLIQNAKPGDQVVFYYSGHGIDVADATKPGGRDSALCPYDAVDQAGLIPGAQIGKLIDRLKTDQVVVIVDACNSGSATRDLRARRRSPKRSTLRLRALTPLLDSPTDAVAPFGGQTDPKVTHKERYIGAARIDQSALEYPFLDKSDNGRRGSQNNQNNPSNPNMGALTHFLLKEVRDAGAKPLTYDTLVKNVRRDLSQTFGDQAQEPQESGPALATTPFLGSPDAPAAPSAGLPIAVSAANRATGRGASIALRVLAGATLTLGSVLRTTGGRRWNEVDDAPSATAAPVSDSGAGTVKVTSATGSAATGVVVSGEVGAGAPLAALLATTPDSRLTVAVTVEGAAGDRLRALCKSIGQVEVVPSLQPSDVTLSPSATMPGSIDVLRGSVPVITIAENKISALLSNFQGGKPLADLQTPIGGAAGTTPIHVTVENAEGKEGSVRAKIGGKASLTITVDQTAYLTIVDLASDGSITGVTLPNAVVAGVPYALPPTDVEGPAGLDTVKVIATTFRPNIPLPASAADAARMGAAGKPVVIARRVLEGLRTQINDNHPKGFDFTALARSTPGAAGAPALIAADGWAVGNILLIIEPTE